MKLMEDPGAWLNNNTRCLYFQSSREDLSSYFERRRLEGDVVEICYSCSSERGSHSLCSGCHIAFCNHYCIDHNVESRVCLECGVYYCNNCREKGFNKVTLCGDGYLDYIGCERVSCSSCLMNQLRNNNSHICPLCYKTAFGILDGMNNTNQARLREQQEQIMQQQRELEELRAANSST